MNSSYLFLFPVLLTANLTNAQTATQHVPATTPALIPATVTKPTVTVPAVAAPQTPQPATPGNLPPGRSVLPAAPLVATKFDDSAFRQQIEAGATVLLIFSETGDPVWLKQAPVLQSILREAEFGRIAVFQIDTAASPMVADRFLVKTPGSLLILKGGVERVRSTRMTKPDAIRKMLRLHTAL